MKKYTFEQLGVTAVVSCLLGLLAGIVLIVVADIQKWGGKPAECCTQHGGELQMIDGRLSAIEAKCKPCECTVECNCSEKVCQIIAEGVAEITSQNTRIEGEIASIPHVVIPEKPPYTPPAGPVPSLPEPKPVKPTTKVGKAVDCK